MTDLARILALSCELEAAGADYVLASVIGVEGSSYRKPGALMLLTADGRRVGTVSGGCLEAEVASRAMWLTTNGPTIQRYSTAEDDGDRPYGSGCGGVVHLLLERRATAAPFLAALNRAFDARIPIAVATVLEGVNLGMRAFASRGLITTTSSPPSLPGADPLQTLAEEALATQQSHDGKVEQSLKEVRVRTDYRSARPAIAIFGAGDDAQPLMRFAAQLGWFIALGDGRSHLATRDRFPLAEEVHVLPIGDLANRDSSIATLHEAFRNLQRGDAAVVMTHSFDQDSAILASLLALNRPPAYIGVLGPQRRTRELLAEAARILRVPTTAINAQAERWLAQVHAPTGLDLGADSPETIALSILAEIQKFRTAATALPLMRVRGASEIVAR